MAGKTPETINKPDFDPQEVFEEILADEGVILDLEIRPVETACFTWGTVTIPPQDVAKGKDFFFCQARHEVGHRVVPYAPSTVERALVSARIAELCGIPKPAVRDFLNVIYDLMVDCTNTERFKEYRDYMRHYTHSVYLKSPDPRMRLLGNVGRLILGERLGNSREEKLARKVHDLLFMDGRHFYVKLRELARLLKPLFTPENQQQYGSFGERANRNENEEPQQQQQQQENQENEHGNGKQDQGQQQPQPHDEENPQEQQEQQEQQERQGFSDQNEEQEEQPSQGQGGNQDQDQEENGDEQHEGEGDEEKQEGGQGKDERGEGAGEGEEEEERSKQEQEQGGENQEEEGHKEGTGEEREQKDRAGDDARPEDAGEDKDKDKDKVEDKDKEEGNRGGEEIEQQEQENHVEEGNEDSESSESSESTEEGADEEERTREAKEEGGRGEGKREGDEEQKPKREPTLADMRGAIEIPEEVDESAGMDLHNLVREMMDAGLVPEDMDAKDVKTHRKLHLAYRRLRLLDHYVEVVERLGSRRSESEELETWRIGDEPKKLEALESVQRHALLLPGVTTLKRAAGSLTGTGGSGSIMLIVDVSGSTMGEVIETERQAAFCIAETARRNGDEIGIITFSTGVVESIAPTRTGYEEVIEVILKMRSLAYTNISGAASTAYEYIRDKPYSVTTFLITDGWIHDLVPAMPVLRKLNEKGKLVIFLITALQDGKLPRVPQKLVDEGFTTYMIERGKEFSEEALVELRK